MNDLIRRQAAIDEAKEWIDAVYFEENDKRERKAIECFIGSLKNMPSAQPEQQWIPCSERLPEEFYVLCCDNHGEMLIANPFECDDSDTGFSAESEDCYMYNCVAWMPLPEPYKGEEP